MTQLFRISTRCTFRNVITMTVWIVEVHFCMRLTSWTNHPQSPPITTQSPSNKPSNHHPITLCSTCDFYSSGTWRMLECADFSSSFWRQTLRLDCRIHVFCFHRGLRVCLASIRFWSLPFAGCGMRLDIAEELRPRYTMDLSAANLDFFQKHHWLSDRRNVILLSHPHSR